MAAFRDVSLSEGGTEGGKHVSAVFASVNLFGLLGARAQAGRLFTPNEERPGSDLVAVLSDAYWDRRLESFTGAIEQAVRSLDKELPPGEVKPMDHYVKGWQSERKFQTLLIAIFAGLALVLAMAGIYGVLSNLVASRVREIGIRMALGARPVEIGRLVLAQSLLPVAIGLAAGLGGALALGRFMAALLFQVRPHDPATLGLAAFAILAISPGAVWVPLRRATRVECTVALREE